VHLALKPGNLGAGPLVRLAAREPLAAGLVPAGARLIKQGLEFPQAVFGGEPFPGMLQGGLRSSLRLGSASCRTPHALRGPKPPWIPLP